MHVIHPSIIHPCMIPPCLHLSMPPSPLLALRYLPAALNPPGVVHVIDGVLLPPAATRTVVDIVTSSTSHTTLASLLSTAGLVSTLQAAGATDAFTVFAPTNAAFGVSPLPLLVCLLGRCVRAVGVVAAVCMCAVMDVMDSAMSSVVVVLRSVCVCVF